jgi:hypothetical protein
VNGVRVESLHRHRLSEEDAVAAIITPSIEGREELLVQCVASVKVQTAPCVHLVGLDASRVGPAVMRSALLSQTAQEYVGFLDDDDLMDEDHVEVLLAALKADGSDLAMSWYRREGTAPETPRCAVWDDWCYGTMLGGRNLIPVTVMARREAILEAGAFRPEDRYEDYSLWMRMIENGSRISVVPRETWTYRCVGENRTWADE